MHTNAPPMPIAQNFFPSFLSLLSTSVSRLITYLHYVLSVMIFPFFSSNRNFFCSLFQHIGFDEHVTRFCFCFLVYGTWFLILRLSLASIDVLSPERPVAVQLFICYLQKKVTKKNISIWMAARGVSLKQFTRVINALTVFQLIFFRFALSHGWPLLLLLFFFLKLYLRPNNKNKKRERYVQRTQHT